MEAIKPATYPETLDFLFNKLPMFSHVGMGAYKKDLGNIIELSEALGNPHTRFKSIHIGGTNGKGSVSHMLAALLGDAGYRTGLYTSPHLVDVRERIRVDGRMITEQAVQSFVAEHFQLIDRVRPSFFEITVALAFDWFRREEVDIAVVEVGLGGRLDSTNILTPVLSVITNVSYDHQQILGNTLTEIAREKAGIIKRQVPVVVGETDPGTRGVFAETASRLDAPLRFADQSWAITGGRREPGMLFVEAARLPLPATESFHIALDLPGDYQKKNLITVLAAVDVLAGQGWRVTPHRLGALAGIRERTGLRGRWEQLGILPLRILDVAHNEAGIAEVLRQAESIPHRKLRIVTGFVRDKAIDRILSRFPRDARYYFTQAAIPRALPAYELADRAGARGLKGKAFPDVKKALAAAEKGSDPRDMILVTGSIFIVADALR